MTKEQMISFLLREIRKMTPVRTGNLQASTTTKRIGENTFEIYVNAGDDPYAKYERGRAPYVPFVNEVWISPRWHGRKNPNEGYWNNGVERAMQLLAKKTGGTLEHDK